jgi:hypothetical protein
MKIRDLYEKPEKIHQSNKPIQNYLLLPPNGNPWPSIPLASSPPCPADSPRKDSFWQKQLIKLFRYQALSKYYFENQFRPV